MVEKKKKPQYPHSMMLRLDDEQNSMLEEYAKSVNIKKTHLIRNSLTSTMFLNSYNPDYPNPKSIFSQSMLHFMFERCSKEDLQELAQISFDLSMTEQEKFSKNNPDFQIADESKPEEFAKNMSKYILSPKGHAWFDECNSNIRGKYLYIYGRHNMGLNFHIFLKHLLDLYADISGYHIVEDLSNLKEIKEKTHNYDYRNVKRKYYKFSVKFGPIEEKKKATKK